jgi:molybdate transport system substrate-binding protein
MNAGRSLASVGVLLFAAACSRDPSPSSLPRADASAAGAGHAQKVEIVVYAAASTRDALQTLESAYERDHAVDLVFNFGSSGDLSKQIVAAAKADVFLSADEKEMDKVQVAGLIDAGTRCDLLSNQLVVIEPADGESPFAQPFQPAQLANKKIQRLSLANVTSVPAGRYAQAWLEKVGVWSAVSDRVLPGVDVRAALGAVESGGAQAGIVYKTDAARSTKARIAYAVPLSEGPQITYPIASLSGRPHPAESRAFVEHLRSQSARAAIEAQGFLVLPPPNK